MGLFTFFTNGSIIEPTKKDGGFFKTMKKAVVFLLLLSLCLSLFAGCDNSNPTNAPSTPTTPTAAPTQPAQPQYDIITIAQALELCGEPGNLTTERYYLQGTVVSIDNPQYGAMTIQDETGTISVYGTYSADGSTGYADMAEKPYKGDIVLLHCTLQNYNGTKEVKNARLISFEKGQAPTVDPSEYAEMTLAQAREAATGTKIKTQGVVAQITYANGQKPAGVILVDGTQSIYVYDSDLAGRVKIGNSVTIAASKTYWILEKEQSNAAKFGYQGCCQLEDVTLLELDESVQAFDKSWIPATTVKAILDTPVTENITGSIYKVNALVKRQDGTGFVNYYFYDLDGTTGSYAYTQCNGSDFAWLDAFDGKICTVYITAINAKSTSSDCYFRLLPVAVMDEGFVFDTAQAGQFAVAYYGLPQFAASYTGDPAMELVTSVSSSLLGFEGAALSYASSNTNVVYFEEQDGKMIFHCGADGKATVTVTGSYGGSSYSEEIVITVGEAESFDTITIAQALATAEDETVTVRGIVGPSVVNKDGFYLFDETGMIAVLVADSAIFGEIEIGHEIVITGRREEYKKDGKTHAGQLCIVDATVLANHYGSHSYPETGFITGKTLADLYDLDVNEYHSTEVYVVTATVNVVETNYYTKIELKSGETTFSLYCASAGQYAFLQAFAGQEVTLEIAPCNWNDKSYYTGCVLAVYTDEGKILNQLNFQ